MMRIERYDITDYVAQFPHDIQMGIKRALTRKLREEGFFNERQIKYHVKRGMDSKLCDLSDTINVRYWLKKANTL